MRRTMIRFGGAALIAALVLSLVPAAHAQRGIRSAAGFLGGSRAGNYGYTPFGYSPYSGYGLGYGSGGMGYGYGGMGYGYGGTGYYGGYASPGTYGYYNTPSYGYYNSPGYSSYSPGYTNYPTPGYYNNVAPGYTYSAPGYSGYQPGMVTGANPAYSNATTGVPATGQTQSMYTPSANAAQITVNLPADATLWVDNMQSTQTGPVRVFVTPATLQPGQSYSYTLRAQWTENGQPVTREKKVDFQAGGQVTVDFMSGTEQ